MPAKPTRKAKSAGASAPASGVEEFLGALEHPMKREILELRAIILGAAPGIGESLKWNAPSFSTTEHFATFHLRAKDAVQVVLHRGAKARPGLDLRPSVPDPASLLDWRGPDRAIVTFRKGDVPARRKPFTNIIRRWVKLV